MPINIEKVSALGPFLRGFKKEPKISISLALTIEQEVLICIRKNSFYLYHLYRNILGNSTIDKFRKLYKLIHVSEAKNIESIVRLNTQSEEEMTEQISNADIRSSDESIQSRLIANYIILNNIKTSDICCDELETEILPGGRIEKGEDAYTALFRELREEINMDIDRKSIRISDIYAVTITDAYTSYLYHNIVIVASYKGVVDDFDKFLPNNEISKIRFIPFLDIFNTIYDLYTGH